MAKWSTGAQVVDAPRHTQYWLWTRQAPFAEGRIGMPEVAMYEASRMPSHGRLPRLRPGGGLDGLLDSMSREEVEAVLGHEIGHVANGDMVTLTLIQAWSTPS